MFQCWLASKARSKRGLQVAQPSAENDSVILCVPQQAVGAIIGCGGQNIKFISEETSCSITVTEQSSGGIASLTIVGSTENIKRARERITVYTNDYHRRVSVDEPMPEGYSIEVLDIPECLLGSVIGVQGAKIRELQAENNVFAFIKENKTMVIKGPTIGVLAAREQVERHLVDMQTRNSIYAPELAARVGAVPIIPECPPEEDAPMEEPVCDKEEYFELLANLAIEIPEFMDAFHSMYGSEMPLEVPGLETSSYVSAE